MDNFQFQHSAQKKTHIKIPLNFETYRSLTAFEQRGSLIEMIMAKPKKKEFFFACVSQ